MAKRLLQRSQFLRQNNYNTYKLDEAIVQNDIPWGDTLIGRLINSISRKAVIAYRSNSIDKLVKSLRKNFDTMMELGQIDIESSDLKMIEIWTLFSELKKLVDEGGDLVEIKNAAKNLRDSVASSDLDDKDSLVEIIEEFIEFLEQFDSIEDSGDEDEDEDEEEEDPSRPELVDPSSQSGLKIYPLLIKNLKSLSLILSQYQVKKGQRGVDQDIKSVQKFYYTTKGGETVESITKVAENKFKWDADKIWKNNSQILSPYEAKFNKDPKPFAGNKFKMQLGKGLKFYLGKGSEEKGLMKEITESFIFEDNVKPGQLGTGGSKERGSIKSNETHLDQAFGKLKKDLDVLVDVKTKGIGVDSKFINEIVSKSIDSKNKDIIFELYYEIQRYLVGDKKSTMTVRDKLYESIDVISDKNKKVIVAEKIARFATRALQFDGEGLYGGLGDIGKPLEDFVNSIKEIVKVDLKSKEISKGDGVKGDIKKEDKKDESIFTSYGNFVKMILEKSVDSGEVKVKFDELFTEDIQNKLCPDNDKIEELKKAGKRPGGTYVIETTDPIISIIRLFQRAYRLHTPGMIPSGRSGGKVSISVFNEYEYMGSGTGGSAGEPGGGPYRNIKLFDKWQAGVDSILADSKYRPLFSENTVFQFEGTEGSGDKIKKGGKMLLRFINKLLDDNDMYRGGTDGGALFQVYEEYFGLKLDQKSAFPGPGSEDDGKRNAEVTNEVSETECTWQKFDDLNIKEKDLFKLFQKENRDDYRDMILKFTIKKDGKDKIYYGFIEGFYETKKMARIIFSEGGLPFDLTKVKMSPKPTNATNVFYGVIEATFQSGSKSKIRYVDIKESSNLTSVTPKLFEEQILSLEILGDKSEKTPFTGLSSRFTGKFNTYNKNKEIAKKILK